MTTLEMAQRPDIGPAHASDGLSLAALGAALFQPRFMGDPEAMLQVPLLFWLASALRPERVLVLGAGDGSLFFALAQAMERTGEGGLCQGIGFWLSADGTEAAKEVPAPLRNHLRQLYLDLGELQPAPDLATSLQGQRDGSFDLLLIDLEHLPAGADITDLDWRRLLAPQAVVLLHGTTGKPQSLIRDKVRTTRPGAIGDSETNTGASTGVVEFRLGAGLTLVSPGGAAPALAPLSASARSGQPFPEVERLFRRLGQGLQAAAGLTRNERAAVADHTALASLRNEKAEAARTSTQLREAYEQRSQLLARTQAELFQSRNDVDDLQEALAEKEEAQSRTGNEVESLRSQLAEQRKQQEQSNANAADQATRAETERAARFRETAALTLQSERLSGELAVARAQAKQLRVRNMELLASTSWRVTAPLRWVKSRLFR